MNTTDNQSRRGEWLERIARAACDQEGNWWRRVEAAVMSGEQKWIDELNEHHDADIRMGPRMNTTDKREVTVPLSPFACGDMSNDGDVCELEPADHGGLMHSALLDGDRIWWDRETGEHIDFGDRG